tara:strand:- start:542 stop:1549 length:1008 start_codon:yes stop_codon:yes gene_type:complete
MIPLEKNQHLKSKDISQLLKEHYANIMPSFYEMQSTFLTGIYKRYQSIESGNILLCFSKNMHLEIIRQREKNLNFDVSLENFWKNFNEVTKPVEKISSVVNITGIPKETVRRKIKNLLNIEFLSENKMLKGYCWHLTSKTKDPYLDIINKEIKSLSKFISKFANILNLNLTIKTIEKEIQGQFSFYWYHFLSCELEWLKMWQTKLKDNDLLLIALQAIIPTLQFEEKKIEKIKVDEIFKIIGKINSPKANDTYMINASTVSDVTGIPRATCIRKLEKLVSLGFLVREVKSKRYFVNQSTDARTKNILNKDNVTFTIEKFSEYFAIILNSLRHNRL